MRLYDHDEDWDDGTLVLIDLFAFLALENAEAREYLSCVAPDGRLTQVARDELGKLGVIPHDDFKPLATLSFAGDDRNSVYWNDPAPLIPDQLATATRNFQIRLAASRVRRALEVLNCLSCYAVLPQHWLEDRRFLTLRRRYQQQPDGASIHAEVFDVESFLKNPIWQAARANARRCMVLLGMTGTKPSEDIFRLAMEFDD